MARESGVWWWEARQCFYTWFKGKRHRLDPDKTKALKLWGKLVGCDDDPRQETWVSHIINQYLDWSESNHSKDYHQRIKTGLLSFGRTLPKTMQTNKLLPYHLTKWLDERYPKQPKEDGTKPVSENTRHDIASDILAAFNWAVKQRLILSSPLQGYTKPPKTPRILYLAPEQIVTLLAEIPDEEFRDFLCCGPSHRLPPPGGPCAGSQIHTFQGKGSPHSQGISKGKAERAARATG